MRGNFVARDGYVVRTDDVVIKSKEVVLLRCGFRSLPARPTYASVSGMGSGTSPS